VRGAGPRSNPPRRPAQPISAAIAAIRSRANRRALSAALRAAGRSRPTSSSLAAISLPVLSSISKIHRVSPTSRHICPFRVSVGCRSRSAGVPAATAMIGECISKLITAAARAYTLAASAVSQYRSRTATLGFTSFGSGSYSSGLSRGTS
jgi:hypothetical protein